MERKCSDCKHWSRAAERKEGGYVGLCRESCPVPILLGMNAEGYPNIVSYFPFCSDDFDGCSKYECMKKGETEAKYQ